MLLPVGIENKILFIWFSTRSDLAEIGRGNHFHLYSAAKSRTKLISGLFFMLNEPHSRQGEEEIQGHTGGQILLTVWNIWQSLIFRIINSFNTKGNQRSVMESLKRLPQDRVKGKINKFPLLCGLSYAHSYPLYVWALCISPNRLKDKNVKTMQFFGKNY